MRNRSIGFIFASLLVWAIVTYFLFLDRPIGKEQNKHKLSNQINQLEQQVRQEIANNEELLHDLQETLQQKKQEEVQAAPPLQEINNDPEKSEIQEGERNQNQNENGHYVLQSSSNSNDIALSPLKLQDTAARKTLKDGSPVIAVLVFSCNRITVQRCLDQLIGHRPSAEQFPIIVSLDCDHDQTAEVIRGYGDQVTLIKQPDQSDIEIPPKEKKFKGYFKIARHYGWALNQVFLKFEFDTAIVVEDDLDIAPDFFEYFLGTYPLLVQDQSLWCVSAWNDNGKSGLIDEHGSHLLYRTDFFPGLGWMLTRQLWLELGPKWPKSYWDDWIRQPEQRKDRACIRPELSRTRTFGKIGVSNGLFFDKHLKFIKLNDQFVPFTKMNLTYLLKNNYDSAFEREVYQSTVVDYTELKSGSIVTKGPVRIIYHTRQDYKHTAKMLGLMDDFRSGVQRTGYRGVVTFFYNGRRVHLAPSATWKGYDKTWS
ncbi:alpha-1,3-mannosyl-glycoprotein 2-beta-N-acetylglucosaminyltransferase [Cephus cinctus]|uniref:Alpha-1,3-mannosyl-glycoprotein 2-beta-N-acetylglucosaminyltransferase n=1 Tax=Cephus cinctus TaxID=211228 RepID=A0AAJ7C9I3_CEPCN|nr:alpha-1,3-mannosyl-glycoprotein 2-beta-N-acetylglucosaminyltransferase [Cephus cinctus]XP_024945113.1 alpha-1,3-mannosyl-glycoprotein 2-beta-N-acetylglucosaminyltransferase [Cephus cinctus]